MIKKAIFIIAFILISIFFGVLVGFNKVIFWVLGGLIIGFVGALIKYLLKNKHKTNYQQQNSDAFSKADEIKKYKDLLDNGMITQEEFEQKKKEILEL